MQDALTDPRCVVTPESLLVDGANGVCRDARLGSREDAALRAGGLLCGAALIAAWLLTRRATVRMRIALVLTLVVAAAIPGAYSMLALRADRPARMHETVASSMRLHDRARAFAIEHGCARVMLDRCASCAPAMRLALAGLRCARPASIELHERAFDGACEVRGRTLVCGAEP